MPKHIGSNCLRKHDEGDKVMRVLVYVQEWSWCDNSKCVLVKTSLQCEFQRFSQC